MVRPEVNFSKITTIMTHPQVLAQCKQRLAREYSHLNQVSGKGKMIDHAVVAKNLGEKKLSRQVATVGSKVLAELYNLNVINDDLQDLTENYTSFLIK